MLVPDSCERFESLLTGFRIALEAQHDLRRSVPSRRNVFSHIPSILLRVYAETSCETEVANLQLAIGVNEQVAGLQVAM